MKRSEEKLASINPSRQEILQQPKDWFVFLSLATALVLNLMLSQGDGNVWEWLRPDCVALVLLHWCLNQSQRVGMSVAFFMGLLMDIGNASLLGQHALAYSVMAFVALLVYRRLCLFNVWQQIPHACLLLFLSQGVVLLTALFGGSQFPGWMFFSASVTGALLWPLFSTLLTIPQRQRPDSDTL